MVMEVEPRGVASLHSPRAWTITRKGVIFARVVPLPLPLPVTRNRFSSFILDVHARRSAGAAAGGRVATRGRCARDAACRETFNLLLTLSPRKYFL